MNETDPKDIRKRKLQDLVCMKKEHQRILEEMLAKYDAVTAEVSVLEEELKVETVLLKKVGEEKRAEVDIQRRSMMTGGDFKVLMDGLMQFVTVKLR